MRIAEQERQEEALTSLKPTRRMKHPAKKVPTPSAAETAGIPFSKGPTHSSAKSTEKVDFLSLLHVCILLFFVC